MQSLSYSLFLGILIFAPLAFGTVEHWSLAILETATALSFLLLCGYLLIYKKKLYWVPGFLPLLLLLGWMILQTVPIPPSLVKILSPATFEIYRPILDLENPAGWIPLSLNPKATLLSFFKFSSYGLFYLLTVSHLTKTDRLKKTVAIVASLGVFIAVQAILQKLTSPGLIYWFREGLSLTPMGPWVYRNHFAGFMEMIFPLVIALFLCYRPQVKYKKNMKEKFTGLFTMPGANRYLLLGTGAVLMALSILLSLSRGGIITLSLAFLFFILLEVKISPVRQTRWSIILTVSVVLMMTWFGWQPMMERFAHIWGELGFNTGGRLPVFRDSLHIMSSFPLFGTGFGTFIDIYPAFRTVPGDTVFEHAHNDYIELLTDGGLVGFILAAWFVSAVVIRSTKTLLKRREHYSILITSGALTGLMAILLHSFVDFQMYNGANALYFFFLCGLAVSGAHTRIQYKTRPTKLDNSHPTPVVICVMLAFTILTFSTWYNLAISKARYTVGPVLSLFLNKNIPVARLQEIHTLFADAARQDFLEPDYRFRMGRTSLFLNKNSQASLEFLQAVRRNPLSGPYIQQLGLSLPHEQKGTAESLMALGLERAPRSVDRHLTYSSWLIKNGNRDKAAEVLTTIFHKRPDKASEIAGYIETRGFNRSDIERMLPLKTSVWHEVGRVMEKEYRLDDAVRYYLQALDFADTNKAVPAYFSRPYNLLQRQKKEGQALEILRMGIEYLPDYAPFRVLLGDYYLKQGIQYRAKEEYLQALRLNPKNRSVRVKVESL